MITHPVHIPYIHEVRGNGDRPYRYEDLQDGHRADKKERRKAFMQAWHTYVCTVPHASWLKVHDDEFPTRSLLFGWLVPDASLYCCDGLRSSAAGGRVVVPKSGNQAGLTYLATYISTYLLTPHDGRSLLPKTQNLAENGGKKRQSMEQAPLQERRGKEKTLLHSPCKCARQPSF